jgi:PKD repeat protein
MVVIGNFKTANGLLRDQAALLDLTGSSAQVAPWATSRYSPYCYNWAFDSYVRGVSFSPDGSYFVINATGGGNGTLCDSTARFETNVSDTNAQPSWVDWTGGDTVWGVTVTTAAVYIGGHNRWNNNPLGVDRAQPGAVPRPGLAALDPVSGVPFTWNPGRKPLGVAVFAVHATATGLWIGSNTDWVGNFTYRRPKLAFFPFAGGAAPASTSTAGLPGTVYLGGSKSTAPTNVLYRVDTGGPAIQSLDSGPDWAADSSDPSPYRNNGSNAAGWNAGGSTNDATVPVTTPNAIFDSERWSPSDNPPMQWSFPATTGVPLQVRLYFANRYSGTSSPGQRVFNVAIDGTTVLNHYDIVADAGDQRGTMKAFNITSDGTVNIDFSHLTENPLINGIEIIRTDLPAPPPTGADNLTTVAFTGTTATATNADNQGIDFGNWRGAFAVGNKVFYGYTDGYLYYRTMTGSTLGPANKIDPYNDPYWSNVDTDDGTTFRGMVPSLYGQIPNLTGMFFSGGRLYYTLFGNSHLYSRWFSPDSGIVDETTTTSSSSVDFSLADGMFAVGTTLYYGSRDGSLRSVSFNGGTVSGGPTVVSGPLVDGVDWTSRATFLTGAPANIAPTAAFTSSCTNRACTFDASTSADSDGSIASYAWDFGDGSNGSGVNPTHAYTADGSYSVTLTVTDNRGGTASVSHGVSVSLPTVGFVAAADAGGGNTTAKTLTIPATAHVGDTALLFLSKTATATWSDPTGVTGWTQVGSYTNGSLVTTVWVKALAAGEPGATVRFTTSAATHASVNLAVYSGVSTTSPIVGSTQAGDISRTTHTTPAITAAGGNWVVSFWSGRSTATRTWSSPAGVSTRDASTDAGSLTIQAVIADSGGAVSAGPYGGLTATTDANNDRSAMWTIELRSS